MRRATRAASAALVLSQLVFATFAQAPDWLKTLGSGASAATAAAIDPAGNVLVVGYVTVDSSITIQKLASVDGSAFWTQALSFSGLTFGQDPPAIAVDDKGDAYVVCTNLNVGVSEMITVKLRGSDGVELWRDVHAPTPAGARGRDIAIADGEALVLGDDGARFDVLRFAPDGTRRWLAQIAVASATAVASQLAVDPRGPINLCGALGAGPQPFFVAQLNGLDGAILWSDSITTPSPAQSVSRPRLGFDPLGGLALAGEFRNTSNQFQALTAAYTHAGQRLWARISTADGARAVAVDPSGDVIVSGNRSSGGPVARRLLGLDGSQVWRRTFGTSGSQLRAMVLDKKKTLWFASATAATNANFALTSVNAVIGVAGPTFTASSGNDQPQALLLDSLRNAFMVGSNGTQYLTVKFAQDLTSFEGAGPSVYLRQPDERPLRVLTGVERVPLSGGWHSAIVCNDALLDDTAVSGLLSLVLYPLGYRVYDELLVTMTQSYAGGFLDELDDESLPRCGVFAATRWNEPAWGQSAALGSPAPPSWPRSFFAYAWNESISAASNVTLRDAYLSALTQASYPAALRDLELPQYLVRSRAIESISLRSAIDRNVALLFVGSDIDVQANGTAVRSPRFYYDAWRTYLTLRNVYGYSAADIRVFYADGTPPPGAGNLPGVPGALPMPIDGPGTVAALEEYFGTGPATGLLGQDDQLLWWVGGHGALQFIVSGVLDPRVAGRPGVAEAAFEVDLGDQIQKTLAQHRLIAPLRVRVTDVYVPGDAAPLSLFINDVQVATASIAGDSTLIDVDPAVLVMGVNNFRFEGGGAGAERVEIGGLRIELQAQAGPPAACPGDIDGDGQVTNADLGILLGGWQIDGAGDLDGDGDTDGQDLGILLANWDQACN